MNTKDKIEKKCDEIKKLLLEKNEKYGDSAISPVRIFSTADAVEQLRVRIDDKISRIKMASLVEDEDVLLDLVGYLILYMISLEKDPEKDVEVTSFQELTPPWA